MVEYDLLNAPPPSPPNPWPRRIAAIAAVVAVLGGVLYYQFRFYREVRAVESFMDALVAGDYHKAHALWHPTETYTYNRFLQDWGEVSRWGKIKSYEIVEIQSSGNRAFSVPDPTTGRRTTINIQGRYSGVMIGVRINNRLEPEYIWVEPDLSLSFPPF